MTNVAPEVIEMKSKADQGDADSANKYANLLYTGSGVEQDFKAAIPYFDIAAKAGIKWAEFMLGVMYQNGQGTDIDYAIALQKYTSASLAPVPLAIFNLGVMAQLGLGQEQNYKLAAYYYERAANLKNANAALNLAQLYHAGIFDNKPDYYSAEKWYKVAIELGSPNATIHLRQVSQFTDVKTWVKSVLSEYREQKITFWDKVSGRR